MVNNRSILHSMSDKLVSTSSSDQPSLFLQNRDTDDKFGTAQKNLSSERITFNKTDKNKFKYAWYS